MLLLYWCTAVLLYCRVAILLLCNDAAMPPRCYAALLLLRLMLLMLLLLLLHQPTFLGSNLPFLFFSFSSFLFFSLLFSSFLFFSLFFLFFPLLSASFLFFPFVSLFLSALVPVFLCSLVPLFLAWSPCNAHSYRLETVGRGMANVGVYLLALTHGFDAIPEDHHLLSMLHYMISTCTFTFKDGDGMWWGNAKRASCYAT